MTESTKSRQRYDFQGIEAKWQERWEQQGLYRAPQRPDPDNKFYMLVMFAYPSGDIHMGHFRNYIIGDAVARQQKMLGKDVLHPFGWDAFGLPAERAAIQRGVHPEVWTLNNIEVSRRTLQQAGISFDWSREVASCLPDYYRWTQWIFIQMFEKGLAYRQRGFVNWCPEDKTVLANEQVKDGKCERCETPVVKKDQVQWYLKITDYADRLIDDLDTLPAWPENVKTMQREWIGRSHGTEIDFVVQQTGATLPVFTTRPDTIYGVTFMAISPESELLDDLRLTPEYADKVAAYRKMSAGRSDIERAAANREKDGVFTGQYAINPFNGEKAQLWVADYVLAGYGTGVVMGVPAHDTRDFAFAKKYGIPIKVVIHPDVNTTLDSATLTDAFVEYGPMANSGPFNGMAGKAAIDATTQYAASNRFGRSKVNYKLKDWSISRQRYWGCPIPIIHCRSCGQVPVPDTQLPVLLPRVENYMPKGRSPLADIPEFMAVKCPRCGGDAERDPDTMDTFICSSWYYLRYTDARNETAPFDKQICNDWLPVDLYVGGITHATGHLIYFRFFHKFLKDIGWLTSTEPATRLFNHGMVMDAHGEVMSKSKGNVVSPVGLMKQRGIDITRLAMYFTAPSEKEVLWSDDSLTGVEKFVLNRLYPIVGNLRGAQPDLTQHLKAAGMSAGDYALYVRLNQTIKRVTEGFDRLQFNICVSAVMELIRDYEPGKVQSDELNDTVVLRTIQLIAPMAPHVAEELWETAGFAGSVFQSAWPSWDPSAVVAETIEIAVQVNGKLRGNISISPDADEATVLEIAAREASVARHLEGRQVVKRIYVKGRLANFVVK